MQMLGSSSENGFVAKTKARAHIRCIGVEFVNFAPEMLLLLPLLVLHLVLEKIIKHILQR